MIGYFEAIEIDVVVVVALECEPETRVRLHPYYGSKSPYLRLKFARQLGEEWECRKRE